MDKAKVHNDEVFELSDISFLKMDHIKRVIFIGKRFGLLVEQVKSESKRGDYKRIIKRFEDYFDIKLNLSTLMTLEGCEESIARSEKANEILKGNK